MRFCIRCALLTLLVSRHGIAQTTSTLTVAVRDQGGAPIAGATVIAQPADRRGTTAADGACAFGNVPPGLHLLTVTARGFVPLQEAVTLEGSAVNLVIRMSTVHTSIEVREKIDDFLAANSVSITKSPQRLLDVPSAVQVIPQAVVENRQIQDIKDLYRNISGVTDSPYSAMTFRGFTQREVLFNGVRGNPYGSLDSGIDDAGFSTSLGRLTNVEFVEVLKGPSAVMFGAGEPGGLVNFVTRKPRMSPAAEFTFRTGSFDRKGGHGEVTGPVVPRANLFYRAAWYQEDRRTFRYNTRNENIHAAAGLSWK
ncbi:MAG TPA: TonB-dependent receptor, partial [Bryobacteraceae bacterium]|nr:TonB-dependent receptor [Bryobacteraceae bacterium]